MIKIGYILILFICFGFNILNAKTAELYNNQLPSELSLIQNTSKEIPAVSLFNKNDLPTTNKILKEKIIYHRGLVTVFYLLNSNSKFLINYTAKKYITSSQTFKFIRLFTINEKRGPPSILFS